MSGPDLSTLADRMRFAARVLQEASEKYGWKSGDWRPEELLKEADHVEAEEREHSAIVEELARNLMSARGGSWDIAGPPAKEQIRLDAIYLVSLGWRRAGDPA